MIVTAVAAISHSYAQNQPAYTVITLGTLGGTVSGGSTINTRGWVMGAANLPGNTAEHATLWANGRKTDLGTLGGANSAVAWPVHNDRGQVAGISDTSIVDPLGETWSCAAAFFPTATGHTCQGFVWQDGLMVALPTLGGNNGFASGMNNLGQVVGWAENTTHDPTCAPPQVLQFEAVIYQPKPGSGERQWQIQQLPPLAGDVDGAATAINDHGQVVGISGICSNAVGGLTAAHAVLWQNGVPVNIGNLGGIAWNTPAAINNYGTVAGFSDLPGDSAASPNYHAFLWTKSGGIQDLGTLPGDVLSIAWGINDNGQVVGQSISASGSSRAFIWQNGVMTDLNTLIGPGPLTLTYANDINQAGQITGGASNPSTGDSPGFVAIPTH